MSLEWERGNKQPGGAPGLEDFIAREHWRPIVTDAALQMTVMALIATMLSMPAAAAFSMMYLVSFGGAIFAGFMAPRVAAGDPQAAVRVARRSVASLLVSGLSLIAFGLTFDGTLPAPPAAP